jgi:hypothetical protein
LGFLFGPLGFLFGSLGFLFGPLGFLCGPLGFLLGPLSFLFGPFDAPEQQVALSIPPPQPVAGSIFPIALPDP